jgi:dTDP-4-dehydrorhamnose reductase
LSLYDSILVTGAGGMVGQALVALLKSLGHAPVGLNRRALDIADPAAVRGVFGSQRPTIVLNCAAHTKVDLCEDEPERCDAINGHAVGLLASLCRESGAALVHYSTDFVFDGQLRRPYRVDDPVGPLSAYGRSKLLGEAKLQESPPDRWLLIRTAWVYGPGGVSFPRTIVERARAGQPLRVVDDEVGSPTYTADLARATLDLLHAGGNGIWHLANGGAVSRFGFARAVLDEFSLQADLQPTTSDEWLRMRPRQARRPAYSVLDTEPFAKFIGRSMRGWRQALGSYRQAMQEPVRE